MDHRRVVSRLEKATNRRIVMTSSKNYCKLMGFSSDSGESGRIVVGPPVGISRNLELLQGKSGPVYMVST